MMDDDDGMYDMKTFLFRFMIRARSSCFKSKEMFWRTGLYLSMSSCFVVLLFVSSGVGWDGITW